MGMTWQKRHYNVQHSGDYARRPSCFLAVSLLWVDILFKTQLMNVGSGGPCGEIRLYLASRQLPALENPADQLLMITHAQAPSETLNNENNKRTENLKIVSWRFLHRIADLMFIRVNPFEIKATASESEIYLFHLWILTYVLQRILAYSVDHPSSAWASLIRLCCSQPRNCSCSCPCSGGVTPLVLPNVRALKTA